MVLRKLSVADLHLQTNYSDGELTPKDGAALVNEISSEAIETPAFCLANRIGRSSLVFRWTKAEQRVCVRPMERCHLARLRYAGA